MSQRLDRHSERKYILPSEGVKRTDWLAGYWLVGVILLAVVTGFVIGFSIAWHFPVPRIPPCLYAPDIIIGNGEYNSETGYWSEYHCVSESAFSDRNHVNRKSGK